MRRTRRRTCGSGPGRSSGGRRGRLTRQIRDGFAGPRFTTRELSAARRCRAEATRRCRAEVVGCYRQLQLPVLTPAALACICSSTRPVRRGLRIRVKRLPAQVRPGPPPTLRLTRWRLRPTHVAVTRSPSSWLIAAHVPLGHLRRYDDHGKTPRRSTAYLLPFSTSGELWNSHIDIGLKPAGSRVADSALMAAAETRASATDPRGPGAALRSQRRYHRGADLRIINRQVAFRGGNRGVPRKHLHGPQVAGAAIRAAAKRCRKVCIVQCPGSAPPTRIPTYWSLIWAPSCQRGNSQPCAAAPGVCPCAPCRIASASESLIGKSGSCRPCR